MRFLFRACQLFFVLGLLSLLIATANQVFGLGIFPNGYPAGEVDSQGQQIASSYGVFMRNVGIITVIALFLGMFLMVRLQRREERAALLLEAILAQESEEADEELDF